MRRERQDRYEVVSSVVKFDKIDDVTVYTITDNRTGQKMFVTDKRGDSLGQSEIDAVFSSYYKRRERFLDEKRRRIKIRRKKIQ